MNKNLLTFLSFVMSLLFLSCEKDNETENIIDKNNTYSYIQNCVDSLDAVLTSKGYLALCGITEVQESDNNSANRYRLIYITKANYNNGEVDHSEDLYVLLDSLNNPVSITTNTCTYTIMNNNGSTFDLMYIDGKNEATFYSTIATNNTKSRANATTRAAGDLASSEPIPFTGLDDIMNAIGKIDNLYNIISATTAGQKVSAGLGALANLIGDAGWAEGSLFTGGISDVLAGSLRSSYLALAGYMWSENQKFILKHLGAWRISIQSVEQVERKSLEIGYTIEGLNTPTEGTPKVNLLCQNLKTRKYKTIPLGNVKNGSYKYNITDLDAGEYGVEMRLYDDCHRATNISVMTYPQVKTNVYDIGLNRVEVGTNPLFRDGYVNFDLDVYIDGSEDGLKNVREFGYFIKFANSIDYHKVEHMSYIFSSTPVTCSLPIEREGFFNLDCRNFKAEATDYYIGVYVVNTKGNEIKHFDEKKIEGLVYERKPEFLVTNINVTDRGPINDDSGRDSYMSYEMYFQTDGWLFFDEVHEKYGENWTSSGADYIIESYGNDASESVRKGTISYSSNNTKVSPITIYAHLIDGSVYTFPQGLYFQNGNLHTTSSTRSSKIRSVISTNENFIKPQMTHK